MKSCKGDQRSLVPSFYPSFYLVPYLAQMIERIDTALGRYLYSRRMGIVEPVFGNMRNAKGMDRFTLRGKVKVDIQWKLYGMVHNIGKILKYGPRFAVGATG